METNLKDFEELKLKQMKSNEKRLGGDAVLFHLSFDAKEGLGISLLPIGVHYCSLHYSSVLLLFFDIIAHSTIPQCYCCSLTLLLTPTFPSADDVLLHYCSLHYSPVLLLFCDIIAHSIIPQSYCCSVKLLLTPLFPSVIALL